MRRIGYIFLGLLAFLLLVAAFGGLLLHTEAFWNWSGWRLVAFAQDRLYPTLTVKKVRGHPLLGITFEDISLTSPEGEVLTAKRLELRFSLWSLVKLEPVIGCLAIYEPQIHIWRQPDGSLNLSHVLRKRPPPPFRSIDLPDILISGGSVTFRENGHLTRYPRFDFRCGLLVLHPKRPEQAIFVRRAMLTVDTAKGRFSLKTRLAYQRQELNVLTMEVYDEAGPIALLGGQVRFSEKPSGILSGEFKLPGGDTISRFLPAWPKAWNVAGKFSLEATLSELKVSSAGELNGSPFILQGLLEKAADWRYEIDLKLVALKPEMMAPFSTALAERLKGLSPVTVRLQATGSGLSWPPAAYEGRLTAAPFSYKQAEVRGLEAVLKGKGEEQTLKAVAKGNFGNLEVEARGPLLRRREGAVKAAVTDLKPHLLGLAAAPPETTINGTFAGSVSLPELKDLRAAGDLKVSGRWGSSPPLEIQGSFAWQKPDLKIAKAALKAGDLAAEFNGVWKDGNLDVQGQAKLPPKGVLPGPMPVSGQWTAAFAAKGPWRAPDLTLEAQGQNLSWKEYRVRSLRLKAAILGWPPRSGNLDLEAAEVKGPFGALAQVTADCRGTDGHWRFLFKVPPSSSGPQAELRGLADLSRRPILLTVERAEARWADLVVRNATPVKVSFLPGLAIEPATFMINQGKVFLAGSLQDSRLSGRLEVQEVAAEVLPLWGLPLKGLLQGQATLSGSPENPRLQGKLRSGPGKVSDFSFKTLETDFNYQNYLFAFSGSLSEKEGGPGLRWEGKLPLHLTLVPLRWSWDERELYILVRGENTNLGMLAAFSREIEEAEGALDLSAEWRGAFRQPRLTGHLRWGPGSIRLRHAGATYHLQPGAIRFEGHTLLIPEIVLQSRGTARISGKVTLAGFLPEQFALRADLTDFKAVERSGSEVFASGTATLSGPWQKALLKGQLVLNPATFRTAFFKTGEHHDDIILVREEKPSEAVRPQESKEGFPAVYRHLAMDLRLSAPEGAWVRNKRLRFKVVGSLKLSKEAGKEEISAKGRLQVKEGTLEVQEREFKVTKGEVDLPGTPGAAVTTRMQATSQAGDITLILNIHGPVRKPDMEFSSVPPLPPADILSYLVFGRPSQALTQQQFRTMGEQAAGILGGLTAKKLKDLLGKDFPLVGNIYMHGGTETMGVAKPLTKELTVFFERKTEPLAREDTNQIRLEYRLNRYFSVESQLGRRNSGADVLFNLDF